MSVMIDEDDFHKTIMDFGLKICIYGTEFCTNLRKA